MTELKEKEVALKERELDALVRKQADAEKYKIETEAEANKLARIQKAEAEAKEAEFQAQAHIAMAKANKASAELDAEEIQINGEVEKRPHLDGEDLTELLKIEKYEPPVSNGSLGELIHHEWYIPKTDEERIQVCADNVLPVYMNAQDTGAYYISIKLDGTSCTAGLFEDAFLIGGRNQWYKDENMYTSTVKKYGDLEAKLKELQERTGKYVAFQGELCGPGIQSNKLGLSEKEWYVFNVFESETGKMDSYTKCDY
ncbi:unnamed protein product [Cylicocyclus nassatus]|uniref:RNA ligase domain-containing protein n=1 Tax=Cylicocyclus nassatus TaxID=53992 RepID=A0AA36MFG8_CYLNA|nr:unnamed protein product [Cylicocyclus nassatus]